MLTVETHSGSYLPQFNCLPSSILNDTINFANEFLVLYIIVFVQRPSLVCQTQHFHYCHKH